MKQNPLFSVLIANYNNGRYLQEAIDSVMAQTYPHWEVVIVDDGSTDNSHSLYDRYATDPRFHIHYNGENRGCAYTKHQCVLHASGTYCGYLDPDDALLPNAIADLVAMLQTAPDAALVLSRHYICDENLNIVHESRPLTIAPGQSYFTTRSYKAEVFAAFPRQTYLDMGGLDTTCRAGVDADLYFRLEEHGRLLISNSLTYKYRIFPHSITANWTKAFYWNLIIRHNTCMRRGLPVEQFSFADFLNFISLSHWDTRPYRLGKLLTNPRSYFRWRKQQRTIKKMKLL